MRLAVLMVVAVGAVAACGESDAASACPEGSELFVEYRLFLGRSSGGVEVVSDEEWEVFLKDIITPKFPAGLTVLDAQGQWRGAEDVLEGERSKLLIILAPRGGDAALRLTEVADGYKGLFNQEAVIYTTSATCVGFR